MSLANVADDYFSNINPIATRIYADYEETKSSYECIWKTLTYEEQSQILNECIIKPEVTLKYSLKSNLSSDNTKGERFDHKQIIDENLSYRDEHAGPFSFKTLSQADLRLFESDKKTVNPKCDLPKVQNKIPPPSTTSTTTRYKIEPSGLLGKLLGRRPSPDAEQEVLVSPQSSTDSPDSLLDTSTTTTSTILPKTGLDFLDNW